MLIDPENITYVASGVEYVLFEVTINDTSYKSDQDQLMNVRVYDPVITRVHPETISALELERIGAADILARLDTGNQHVLSVDEFNMLRTARHCRNIISPTFWDVLTGAAKRMNLFYITTSFQTVKPPNITVLNGKYLTLEVKASTIVVQTEKQDLAMSITDLLNEVGGFSAIALALYYILFGDLPIGPWGLVQSCMFRKHVLRKFKEALQPEIPFHYPRGTDTSDLEAPVDLSASELDNSVETRLQRLEVWCSKVESRNRNLELFLKEYVIDVDIVRALEELEQECEREERERRRRHLTRFTWKWRQGGPNEGEQ